MLKTADIVFEDKWILVVNKPAGLVVNKSTTILEDTLQDDLSVYFGLKPKELGIGDRAGIVHRLDRETSGLLVVAKTKSVFENLQAQFKGREVQKKYITLVHGRVNGEEGQIEGRIMRIGKFGRFGIADSRSQEGKEARTDYKVVQRYVLSKQGLSLLEGQSLTKSRLNYLKKQAVDYALLDVFPKTGRTHQIRVHLKSIGHPVVSDLIYGPGKLLKFDILWCPRLFLHAGSISFMHPATKKKVEFEVDLPQDLREALERLTTND
ncbi:MAG TPA: RluA family pseudouridine synthase [Candidatus Saccharimonadales bacterium]|nr:RluA family pseudouridine synthase [Candidatus Saccharimonadales bacterium]